MASTILSLALTQYCLGKGQQTIGKMSCLVIAQSPSGTYGAYKALQYRSRTSEKDGCIVYR